MFEETKVKENLKRMEGFLKGVIGAKNEDELNWLYKETSKIVSEIDNIMENCKQPQHALMIVPKTTIPIYTYKSRNSKTNKKQTN